MDIKEILKHVDHTLLLQGSTWEEIKQICDDAMQYETASVCIAPSYVKEAAEYMNGRIPVCTVIGFPNGYMTTAAKEFETKDALANGASEIDMVINIGWLKDKKYDLLKHPRIKQTLDGGREPFIHGQASHYIDDWQNILLSNNPYELLDEEETEYYLKKIKEKTQNEKHQEN